MFADIRTALRPAVSLLVLLTLLTGLAYPLLTTGIAQVIFPSQANGSLIERDGHVVGSALIGQGFASARYFHSRPSAAGKDGYDASSSAASNLAPGSQDLHDRLAASVAGLRADGMTSPVPPDLVTTSASGLDPQISPEAAFAQIDRVARVRGLPREKVAALVADHIDGALAGFLGGRGVNVLELNLALDGIRATNSP